MPGIVKRTSITVGRTLAAFFSTGRVRAPSASGRIERLAQRYIWMADDLASRLPGMFSPAEWRVLLNTLAGIDLDARERRDDLAAALRERSRAARNVARTDSSSPGCDLAALSSRVDVMRPAEQLALVDMTERLFAEHGVSPPDEAIRGWLAQQNTG
jgi:hypothetical protein